MTMHREGKGRVQARSGIETERRRVPSTELTSTLTARPFKEDGRKREEEPRGKNEEHELLHPSNPREPVENERPETE